MAHKRRALAPALAAVALSAAPAYAASPGALDPSFGGGVVGSGTQLLGVGVQTNGEVVAAGQSGGSVLVQCLSAAGASVGQFVGGPGFGRGVAIQADGKIVVVGSSGAMFAQRFNANCTPDASFNQGKPAFAPLGGASAAAVALQPDGKIVVAGSVPHTDTNGSSTRPALARFNAGGSLDTSFGSGGVEVIDHGHPYAVATGLAVQPDGKILLSGNWEDPTYPVTNGWIERFNSAGADDSSFAGGGVYQYFSHGAGYASLNAIALQQDGKIVAAGVDLAGPSAAFVRLDPDGVADSSFGSAGSTRLPSGTFTGDPYGAYGVGIAGGGRIVGAGAVYENGAHNAGIWALTPAGAPDPAFGGTGAVVPQLGAEACGEAVAPDGSLVVVGGFVSAGRAPGVLPCTSSSASSGFAARYIGFGPPPKASSPAVITGAASGVTQTSATLHGEVNPNGLGTSYHFEYGMTAVYGSSTPSLTLGAGGVLAGVSATLTGLRPATTYHYRLVASNSSGSGTGTDASFTTASATRPTVLSGGARHVGETSATLTGQLNPNGIATNYRFEYGTAASYGGSTHTASLSGAGGSEVAVSARLSHLKPRTTYHYRLIASNAQGTSSGTDRTFKTAPRLSTQLRGLRGSYSIAALEHHGLGLTVRCNQGCSIRGSLVIPAAVARRLKLGKRQLTIAGASSALKSHGARTLSLHVTRSGAKLLGGAVKHLEAAVLIVVHPAGGGPAAKFSRSVSLGP